MDGGLATELERRGHDLGDALWSARILADDPGEIRAVHQAYLDAGARVVVTASYQVSREGFVEAGRTSPQADAALRTAVEVAREAVADRDALVAASVGPYGAILHDGSEYRGRYGVSHAKLVDFHGDYGSSRIQGQTCSRSRRFPTLTRSVRSSRCSPTSPTCPPGSP